MYGTSSSRVLFSKCLELAEAAIDLNREESEHVRTGPRLQGAPRASDRPLA